MIQNYVLREAVESTNVVKVEPIVAAIKKIMNTCKLTKFKSQAQCSQFYSSFFLTTLPDDQKPTVEQWGAIYTTLLSNEPFCADLATYMAMWQPAVYTGIFMPLWNQIQSELAMMKENQVRHLSEVKAMLTMVQVRMDGVGNMVKTQVSDTEVTKFITVVNQTLTKMIFDLNKIIQDEITKAVKPDDIVYNTKKEPPLSESAQELIALFETAEQWIDNRQKEIMDEGIINNAKEKAKELLVAKKKAENEFDEQVMKKVKQIREERRNKKHAEMVGESLRINRVIKRLLRTGVISLLNPAWGAISFIISVVYDRSTDKRDRQVLVDQLKDELEIVEEKIQMAERNGDEKARIELIRFRQKLSHEYERIQRMRWDASTRQRSGINV